MGRIRINELARELEVKPGVILRLLPSLGITEKKTHSSSIEGEQANQVRRKLGRLQGVTEEETKPRAAATKPMQAPSAVIAETVDKPGAGQRAAAGPSPTIHRRSLAATAAPPAVQPAQEADAAELDTSQSKQELPRPGRAPQPLRPPLAIGKSGAGAGVAAPPPPKQSPPVSVPPPRARKAPVQPPIPKPKPGQILSGPRQPLPPGLDTKRPAARSSLPSRPSSPTPATPRPPARPQAGPLRPAQPIHKKPSGPIVGKPAERPVVPPRPDLVARLQQQAKMPGQPQPRPQRRGQHTPVPGQPIYRGPIRPGQPIVRGPAPPGGRRRGQHPTSGQVPSPAPMPPSAPGRRHQAKPSRGKQHQRDRDQEGKLRAPMPRRHQAVVAPNKEITVSEGITVKELSERLGIKASLVIKKLVERKIFATINQALDAKTAEDLARVFGASTTEMSFEEESSQEIESAEAAADQVVRPPVVTVMGHVDHGKTSLLDMIRSARVAEREAGGITQHIGAYHVEHEDKKIVFVDTPGHEAFTRMRARGAKITDIVILVVAADDGVMPQTIEAINHARAAEVPIIVAINKVDRPNANVDRVKQQLADRDLLAEDWGGQTVTVPVSAKTGENLDLLLEMILLVADLQDLKANPDRPAVGTVLEAQLDRGRGPVATVLVRNGTLKVGDHFICGAVFGRVRAMFDDRGEPIKSAGPSMPVEVLGLETLPDVGDTYQVVTDTVKAKQIVLYREGKAREVAMAKGSRLRLDRLHEQLREGETKELNIILKADVGGSAEVVADALQKLSNEKVKVRVLHSGVGAVTESDVLLATASEAVVVGFNVRPERSALQLADQEKIDIRLHTIIYELTDEIKKAMSGLLEPVFKEVFKGRAEVRDVFRVSKVGTIAGCFVQEGSLTRDSSVRLLRDNIVVHTGKVGSLKRFKDDASEVKTGLECGVGIENFNDVKPGDVIESFVMERVAEEALV